MLKCGASEVKITPDLGMGIPGYFDDRRADGIKDDLYAKALAMEADGSCAVVIVCDTINLTRQDVLRIRKKIADQTGLCPDVITVSATHTHTGGPSWSGFESRREPEYINRLVAGAAEAGISAYQSMRPAKLGFGIGELTGISFIRRFFMKDGSVRTNPSSKDPNVVKEEGVPDDTLTVVRVEDTEGRLIAVVTNFGVHLDTVGGAQICADYPGVLSEHIKKTYGTHVVSLFLTGPCGNTNHINHKDPTTFSNPEMYQRIGDAMFLQVRGLVDGIQTEGDISIRVATKRLLVNLRRPTAEQLEWAKAAVEGRDTGMEKEADNSMFATKLFAKEMLELQEKDLYAAEFEVKLVQMGDGCLAAWPGEVFVDFGQTVRAAYPGKPILIAELSNGGAECYIPTKEAYGRGGYEPRLTSGGNVEEGTGERIAETTIELLKKCTE